MKKLAAFIMFSLFVQSVFCQMISVEVESMPKNIDEFVALRDSKAVTPEGGAAMFAIAELIYGMDEKFGMQCFSVMLVNDGSMLRSDPKGYKGYAPSASNMFLLKQLDYQNAIAKSYIRGATPEDRYALPDLPYIYDFSSTSRKVLSDHKVKVFISSSGASTPRPVTLEKNDKGLWKVRDFSSLVVGVNEPKVIVDDL